MELTTKEKEIAAGLRLKRTALGLLSEKEQEKLDKLEIQQRI